MHLIKRLFFSELRIVEGWWLDLLQMSFEKIQQQAAKCVVGMSYLKIL
jgi:hypothetical protein